LNDHPPILISSNSDFVSLGFEGNGSSSNPYIIENLNITSTEELVSAIQVGGTNVHFIIRNCKLTSAYVGVRILNTISIGTAQIINNTISSSSKDGGGIGCGIGYTTMENNTISGFMQGIHLNYASHCSIKGNNILLSYYQGINIRYSSFTEIKYNTIKNSNQHGLAIVGSSSSNNIIHHNTFINNSNEATFRIDGERTGVINSQGYDEGVNNYWFDETSKHGNWWDDFYKKGEYKIDGPSNSIDEYPLKFKDTERNNLLFVAVLAGYLAYVLWKKRRKREINQ
jgi:parallel beta-helix repeat protein